VLNIGLHFVLNIGLRYTFFYLVVIIYEDLGL